MIADIKSFVIENSSKLFKGTKENLQIEFDNKGFWFDPKTEEIYNQIKYSPHLYVAFTKNKSGYYYIGKSSQKGGRWRRNHAYHLGTLAYHLLNCIRSDDQNHQHWIDNWMDISSLNLFTFPYNIKLKEEVYISFIPFKNYSLIDFPKLQQDKIKEINKNTEKALIKSYRDDGLTLLNIH